jgi:hypothetical protein
LVDLSVDDETSRASSDRARWNRAHGLGGDLMSVAEAHRRTGISVKALLAAIHSRRLEALGGTQAGDKHWGRPWRITPEAIDRFIASCPPCAWPGCDRPGVTAAGRCSKQHSGTLEHLHSPEARARQANSQRGVPRPHTPEHVENGAEAMRRFFADPERSQAWRDELSERMTLSWETGKGAAPASVVLMGGRTRSRWFGRWAGKKAGRQGGRTRGYSDLQRRAVLALKLDDPSLGRERLARMTNLSPDQIRAILSDAKQS